MCDLQPKVESVTSQQHSLEQLVILRTFALAGQTIVLVVTGAFMGVGLPMGPLFALVGGLALINGLTMLRLRGRRQTPVGDRELFVQLTADVIQLALVLALAGGATNPFTVLFLLPLTIAAAVLPAAYTGALTALVVAAFSGLLVVYKPMAIPDHVIPYQIVGLWFGFVICAMGVAWFVVRMANGLRRRDQELARAREQALRDEKILALATQAASAAHDLGTPLSTIQVLAGELARHAPDDAQFQSELATLRGQLERCKQVSRRLLDQAGCAPAESGAAQHLPAYLDEVLSRWQLHHPRTEIVLDIDPLPDIRFLADDALEQALYNLLDNAAQASPARVTVQARVREGVLELVIDDEGPGIPEHVLSRLGREPVTTRPEGRGFGVLLACAVLERLGGGVQLKNRDAGGASTRVRLPLVSVSTIE